MEGMNPRGLTASVVGPDGPGRPNPPSVRRSGPSSSRPEPPSLATHLAARLADSASRPALVDALAAAPPTRQPSHVAAPRGDPGPPETGPQSPVGPSASQWTWADLAAAALDCRAGLLAAGLAAGDRVVHVGPHTPDWVVVDLACLLGGFVHAALHVDTPARDQARQIAWLQPVGVVRSGPQGLKVEPGPRARSSSRGREILPALAAGVWRHRLRDPAGLAAEIDACTAAIDPDACGSIFLSSGTTGHPHGMLHSQRALAENAAAVAETFLDGPRDVRLSWLPMSHALARTGELYTALVRGGCLALVTDRHRLLVACERVRPTVILGVPAFFERLEQATRAGRIADLAAALGGCVRMCVSGAAPLRLRTAEFFRSRGVPLVEGYGLAEAGPVVAVANPRNRRPGTVGPPLRGIEVRIDDRPATAGQLLVRTPSRALGVLAPGATMPTLPEDDWLATGDRAELDDSGHLRIIGRLRDTLVLASGTKLPPAEVERRLAEDDVVAQVCVVGDGLPFPVALIVPEPAVLRAALGRLGAWVTGRRGALAHPRVLAWFGRRLARLQADLPGSWQVRRAVLVGRAFDAAHGETTESLKLRRAGIERNFRRQIDAATRSPPPRGVCLVPSAPGSVAVRPAGGRWLVPAVWHHADGGFATAAALASAAPRDRIVGVVERSQAEIVRLREAGQLYDPHPGPSTPSPPLDDPPPARSGRFSAVAEEALGEAGFWGLAVPEAFSGSGCTLGELARVITLVAADCPTAAGTLAVHSAIGAVSALAAFGSPEQQARHLPGLAAGRPLSVFGGTEPEVGCDLGAVRTTLSRSASGLSLSGTKMFITGATHGRLVKLLAVLDGRPAVALVRLPAADSASFRLRHYGLHPLKHAHNAALEFRDFPVAPDDLLAASPGRDGMEIVWHGLNRGRVTLAAQAAGTLRLILTHAADHARRRHTWGRALASRELVQGRLGRIAAAIAACDAVAGWAAAAIDAGGSGELEAIVAKTVASGCVRASALDALAIHGGRCFLLGHPLGDSLHDHLAVGVYEGESELLGLALVKGLAKRHPLAPPAPAEPAVERGGRASAARVAGWKRAAAWLAWRAALLATDRGCDRGLLDRRLRQHAREARRGLDRSAVQLDRALRRHGPALAELQLEAGSIAATVRDLAAVLATAWHADASGCERQAEAADVWCRLALAAAAGRHPDGADHRAVAALGARVAACQGR